MSVNDYKSKPLLHGVARSGFIDVAERFVAENQTARPQIQERLRELGL